MSALAAVNGFLLAGEALGAVTLLAGLAWLGAVLFPARAALRHLIWVTAFAAMLALPLPAFLPARIVIHAAPPSAAIVVPPSVSAPAPLASVPAISPALPDRDPPQRPAPARVARLAQLALLVWAAGALLLLLRLVWTHLRLARLYRRSRPFDAPLPLPRFTVLRRIEGPHGPFTWGLARSVILLPSGASSWPRERLMAVLRHEIAHVRRRDAATQMLAQLTCLFYWPHPLVWLGARQLRQAAEIAADDAVLAQGVRPSVYAETLLALAAEFRGRDPGLAMASASALGARVQSILAPLTDRKGVTVMDVFKIASLGTAAVALLALARPGIAAAEIQPPAPAAPMAAALPLPPVPPLAAATVEAPKVHATAKARAKADAEAVRAEAERVRADAVRVQADLARPRILAEASQSREAVQTLPNDGEDAGSKVSGDWNYDKNGIQVSARVDAAVTEAMAHAGPEGRAALRRALPEIRAAVSQSLKDASQKIDAAIARATAAADSSQP